MNLHLKRPRMTMDKSLKKTIFQSHKHKIAEKKTSCNEVYLYCIMLQSRQKFAVHYKLFSLTSRIGKFGWLDWHQGFEYFSQLMVSMSLFDRDQLFR